MPRLKSDITIIIRKKDRNYKVEVFFKKENNEFIRLKLNGRWYKNKLFFHYSKLKNLIFNTLVKDL